MPENTGYMTAAYIVAAVILAGYAVSLVVRVSREKGKGEEGRGKGPFPRG